MSGGGTEITAGYISNGNWGLNEFGSSMVNENISAEPEGYRTKSSKYVTVYPFNDTSDTSTNNYIAYKDKKYGYGDAILETSTRRLWHKLV